MRGDLFDRILASAPVNKGAALAVGRGGAHFETIAKPSQEHWSAPPRYRRPLPGQFDLTGHVCGRLTVLGQRIAPERSAKNCPGQWVVRCRCGDYEVRTAKALRNPKNVGDRCIHCRRTEYLRNNCASSKP